MQVPALFFQAKFSGNFWLFLKKRKKRRKEIVNQKLRQNFLLILAQLQFKLSKILILNLTLTQTQTQTLTLTLNRHFKKKV